LLAFSILTTHSSETTRANQLKDFTLVALRTGCGVQCYDINSISA
jgi:hypothetical protein